MLYYILFWTLLGFIIHFYIIFGTNLLTGGPAQNCYFLPISEFRRKRISNGVQTEWNLRERDFRNERDPDDLDPTSRHQPGSHEVGGRAYPPGAPSTLVGPTLLHRRTSSSYIYLCTPKLPDTEPKPYFHHRNFLYLWDPILGPFRSSAGGGIDHGGPLHQLHGLFGDVWVVYFRPSGP